MKLAGILLVVIAVMTGIGYWYYNDTQEKLSILQQNNAQLEVAVQISEASVATLQANAVRNAELNATLQRDLQTAEKYGDELRATLQQHNLTALAQRRPGLIEDRMQDATNKLWDDLRGITDPNGMQSDAGTQNSNSN